MRSKSFRELDFSFLSNQMEYDRTDKYPFDYVSNKRNYLIRLAHNQKEIVSAITFNSKGYGKLFLCERN